MNFDSYLRPLAVAGEVVRFDLSSYRSTVTRQMLQIRVRMTAEAFGVGSHLVAANVTDAGTWLEVDATALNAANAAARARIEAGPEGSLAYLRRLSSSRSALDRSARAFARTEDFLAYVQAAADYQALGALKFCLPEDLRPRVGALLGDSNLVEPLLAPEAPTLWSDVNRRELRLAAFRRRGDAAEYQRRLAEHRRAFGYLRGEDVEFRGQETLEAIDARMAALGARGKAGLTAERRRLAAALAADRAAKAQARAVFADRVASAGLITLVAQVLLARALASHEDSNRLGKMRFLRDLRDLAERDGLPLETAGLDEFAAACLTPRPVQLGGPVLRSL